MPRNLTRLSTRDTAIVGRALAILNKYLKPGAKLSSRTVVRQFLSLKYGHAEFETFSAIWLTTQNTVIAFEEISSGTITQTPVFPREVMKSALSYNAAAVIFAHNHPSGNEVPSDADKELTHVLSKTLGLIDVRVLDHIVVAGADTLSFAEQGISLYEKTVVSLPAKRKK